MKSIVSRWFAGGLLLIAASGCATDPRILHSPGPHTRGAVGYLAPDGKYDFEFINPDDSGVGSNVNRDDYYYHWRLEAADGSIYERTESFVTDPNGRLKDYYHWYVLQPIKAAESGSRDGSYEGFGWDVSITHPPGGVSQNKVVVSITHPPGGTSHRRSR